MWERKSGFYSRNFIVPKKDGGLCPIIDLCLLNHAIKRQRFKMLTIKQIVSHIRSEDWFVTIDLKDTYFHVSVLPQHRKFLRFAFGSEAYQYRILPFGLSLSPRTFTKCVDVALALLRLQCIRILNYIDDWLILAQSKQLVARHRDAVLTHIKELLSPVQRTTYLGVVWDSTMMQAHLSPVHIDAILTAVRRVRVTLTVKQFQRLLDLMAAASNVIPFGLLYLRPLQWWLRNKGFSPRGNPLRMIKVMRGCLRALDMWRKLWFLSQGPTLGASCRSITLNDRCLPHGLGSGHEWPLCPGSVGRPSSHVAHKLPRDSGRVSCTETLPSRPEGSSCACLHRQHIGGLLYQLAGGLRSHPLYRLAHQILLWAQGKLLSLRAVYIPGHLNQGADILSRQWRWGGAPLEGVRPGGSGSICVAGNNTLYAMVLPHSSSSAWAGRHGADMVQDPSSANSPILAGPSMVLGPCVPSRRLSVGDSDQECPFLSDGGLHPSPPPGVIEAVGVAPEGAQLLVSGCWDHTPVQSSHHKKKCTPWSKDFSLPGADSNCKTQSVALLVQLWSLCRSGFSARLSPSTLKVYVVAIAAYHTHLGGQSLGRHPLVSHFLCGTLRPV